MKKQPDLQRLQEQKKRLSLRAQLTLIIGLVVVVSIALALLLEYLLEMCFPVLRNLPALLQLNLYSFVIATIVARFVTQVFSEPIRQLCMGMRQVSGGDFSVQLETKSKSGEIQELFAGFNRMVQELQSTEILQSDFVSNVSHEFKTPINAIEGYTTLLQNTDNIDEVENEYIEKILFNTRRLSSLVSNILLLSKIENQTIPTNRALYRLDEQVREAILALESMWEPKEIDFDVDLAEVSYFGNENLLYHVWMNLMSNAIKFSPQGGTVKIRLYASDAVLRFTVEDQGPGLSEEAKKHVFDKFYQADTSHKAEGNGLGLALVKRIVTGVGGKVSVENLPHGGCRFTVLLYPSAPEEAG